jgi:hypothetical protein
MCAKHSLYKIVFIYHLQCLFVSVLKEKSSGHKQQRLEHEAITFRSSRSTSYCLLCVFVKPVSGYFLHKIILPNVHIQNLNEGKTLLYQRILTAVGIWEYTNPYSVQLLERWSWCFAMSVSATSGEEQGRKTAQWWPKILSGRRRGFCTKTDNSIPQCLYLPVIFVRELESWLCKGF